MKKIITLLSIIPYLIISQEVTTETMFHNGIERSYILYVPESYSENTTTPLVLNLHGYSSNAGQQMVYSDFYNVAETEGFILVHPEGTIDDYGFQFSNSGDLVDIDDTGFLSVLIGRFSAPYNAVTTYKNFLSFFKDRAVLFFEKIGSEEDGATNLKKTIQRIKGEPIFLKIDIVSFY